MPSGKRKLAVANPTRLVSSLPAGYDRLLADIRLRIRAAQVKAALAANTELIRLYWSIGRDIVEGRRAEGWGKTIVERLALDLQRSFPGLSGFSPRIIWRMRSFYLVWAETQPMLQQPVGEMRVPTRTAGGSQESQRRTKLPQGVAELDWGILPRPVAQLPWGHNVILIEKVKHPAERLWYAQAALGHGWSRVSSFCKSKPACTAAGVAP